MRFLYFVLCWILTHSLWLSAETSTVDFKSSNLPVVIINTYGRTIPVSERIVADMAVLWKGDGQRNYLTDRAYHYNGRIEIELHGQTSLGFAKQSYRIECQDSSGENLNVPLLGLPKENDWILYGPYSDKTLMRNALAYTLAGEINDYAPRVKFCELVLNNKYRGVYILTERIKRDNNRVDICEMLPQDISEPEISGGYIFKKDKTNYGDKIIRLSRGLELIIIEPKKDEILPAQTTWLRNYLNNFDKAITSGINYADYMNMQSFVDNFLIVEFTKNIDGFRLSTYFYKDRNDRIVAGPVWDYNLSFGNADYMQGWTYEGWYYLNILGDNNWWLELVDDPAFNQLCVERWIELRSNQFSESHIFQIIDAWSVLLEEAQKRNFEQFPILGIYIWPNPGYPQSGGVEAGTPPRSGAPATWAGEIQAIKDFIRGRLQWMDQQFGLQFVDLTVGVLGKNQGNVFYNNCMLSGEVYLGPVPTDKPVELYAEPRPGYQFVQWEKIKTGKTTKIWVNTGAQWKYLDNGSDQGTAWYSNQFDDSNWKQGEAELGYGDQDEKTIVSYGASSQNKFVTTYFRKNFQVADAASFDDLTFYLLRDDGAVVYLNGSEVVRSNMPASAIGSNTLAKDVVDGDNEKTYQVFHISSQHLIEGDNLLAVEVHQQNRTSSDISFNLRFMGKGEIPEEEATVIGTSETLTYLPTANSTLTAVFRPVEGLASKLIINEVYYNSPEGEYLEFIELYNHSDATLDLSGCSFLEGPRFTFYQGTNLNPGEFILVSQDSTSYSHLQCHANQWISDGLSNDGELLLLTDSAGNTIDSVNYSASSPWPETANGTGYSLELKHPSLDNSNAVNWQRSYQSDGSPGQPAIQTIDNLLINEFLASNHNINKDESGEYDDWIELYNASGQAVDVGGLYISDKKDRPDLWQIPAVSPRMTTLEPGHFLLVWADDDSAQGIFHLGFQLDKTAGTLSILQMIDGAPRYLDSLTYSSQASDVSVGRLPDGSDAWYLFSHPTPGMMNVVSGVENDNANAVETFSLIQNYPNPFNPQTTIAYTVGSAGPQPVYVELKVFDIMGREVGTLVSKNQVPGEYSVRLNAAGLASGLYFYRLKAGNHFTETKKLILLR